MEMAISGVKWGGNGVEMEMEMASHFPVSEMEMETAVEMGVETARNGVSPLSSHSIVCETSGRHVASSDRPLQKE